MPCVCSCSWRPEGGVASFGAGVTSDYEPPTAPNFIFINVCIYTYATCVKGYKRALDPQELESQTVVRYLTRVLGTKFWLLWKSSKYSKALSCLSNT